MLKRLIPITGFFIVIAFLTILAAQHLMPNRITNALIYNIAGAATDQRYESSKPSDTHHIRSVNPDISLEEIIRHRGIKPGDDFNVHVDLASRTLQFRHGSDTLKEYRIAGGSKTGLGDKEKEGDYRTPRGEFFVCSKEVYNPSKIYLGSRWMLLSYPGIEAAERGLESKLIDEKTFNRIKSSIGAKKTPPQDTPLGSAVGIHGGAQPKYPRDWTAGCIGMYDQDVEEIFKCIKVGTKVVIE